MKKAFIIIVVLAVACISTSCSSGWSCKKRYVNQDNKTEYQKQTINPKV